MQNLPILVPQTVQLSSDEFLIAMLRTMHQAHPEKSQYIGKQALDALINKGCQIIGQQEIAAHHQSLFCMLMFCFGHGCLNDPLYPWIAPSLCDDTMYDVTMQIKIQQQTFAWVNYLLQPTQSA
jgi:hypothetical protein